MSSHVRRVLRESRGASGWTAQEQLLLAVAVPSWCEVEGRSPCLHVWGARNFWVEVKLH